jgi:hypothetical protein
VELIAVSHLDEVFTIAFKGMEKPKPTTKASATNGKTRNGSKPTSKRSALGRVK